MQQSDITTFKQRLGVVPEMRRLAVDAAFKDIAPGLPDPDTQKPGWFDVLPYVLAGSEFCSALLRRDPSLLGNLVDNGDLYRAIDTDRLGAQISALFDTPEDEQLIMTTLRQIRNQAMLHVCYRDLAGWAPLDEVLRSLSDTADLLIDTAMQLSYAQMVARYGTPIGAGSGRPQQLVALGMGKLGGRELNFSSDVDLILCFPENGETDGSRVISNSEFFTRQARLLIKYVSATTADGFVYRVDTRLRPNGDSGPLTLSFAAMESYYQSHGRDWERYALIKARVVAGDRDAGNGLLASLRPFVYRKYLDYAALESIRDMKEMIQRELARKDEIHRNVKLGPGGIREIEFIAQAHQLIRGGRDKSLQQRGLLQTLQQLEHLGLITGNDYEALVSAYDFLRRCENRLQMYADQQTHNLPRETERRQLLAAAMDYPDWQSFDGQLRDHMAKVHRRFTALFMETERTDDDEQKRRLLQLWNNALKPEAASSLLLQHGYTDTDILLNKIHGLRQGPIYRGLSHTGRNRLDRLMPVVMLECGDSERPDQALQRLLDLLAAICRRAVYLSLLLDNRPVRRQLIHLCASSAWISNWMSRHPILLDDILSGHRIADFERKQLVDELNKRLADADDDLEQQMTVLREFHHAKVLAVAAMDIGKQIDAGQTGQALTAVAEACLEASLAISIQGIVSNHGVPEGCQPDDLPFCVIGYGKLGSAELGFGSDLDMVFVSGDIDETQRTGGPRPIYNAQFFARLGQRFVHILSTLTPAGRLYEVDMRLRPSGNSGPLVANLGSLQKYQREQAWTWEHQALVRARFITGQTSLAGEFAILRSEILRRRRNGETLRAEVVEMREKMRSASDASSDQQYDLKQGHGGIVDIEFMVQYMVLRWASDYPQLCEQTGTIGLLDDLLELGLVEVSDHQVLTTAFSRWLDLSYLLKLDEQPAMIDAGLHVELRQQVTQAWERLFPESAL